MDMVEQYTKRICMALRSVRNAKGMTIEGVALESGVSPGTIIDAEKGKSSPRVYTLVQILLGMNASLADLVPYAEVETQ